MQTFKFIKINATKVDKTDAKSGKTMKITAVQTHYEMIDTKDPLISTMQTVFKGASTTVKEYIITWTLNDKTVDFKPHSVQTETEGKKETGYLTGVILNRLPLNS